MATMQNSTGYRKTGQITRSEKTSAAQQVESLLNDVKQKAGKVILVQISARTSIELPANLSPAEIEARVEKYINLHKSKV